MTIEAGAVAPVEGQTAVSAPAPAEPVIRDLDQVAEPEKTEQPPQEAKPEETNSETQEGDDSSQPKKLTRNQRLQRKAARLSTMLAEVSAENERLKTERTKAATEGEPKEADYNGDWGKFQAEYAAWKVTQNIRGDLAERDQRDRNAQLQDRIREATDDFLERVEDVKKSIPDYDKVVETFAGSGGKFAPHVIEEIRDSEKGPMLAYTREEPRLGRRTQRLVAARCGPRDRPHRGKSVSAATQKTNTGSSPAHSSHRRRNSRRNTIRTSRTTWTPTSNGVRRRTDAQFRANSKWLTPTLLRASSPKRR
jgi:flagellar motility protein MotE (MotC chaperone)